MTASAEKWIKDAVEAWESGDIEGYFSFYTDDCINEHVAAGKVLRGKEELRNYYKALLTAFPDFKVEIKSCFASGNQVCSETIYSATHKGKMPDMPMEPTGKHWSVPGVRVDELKDGKSYRSRIYFDMASILQQLGVMPGPPQ